MKTIYRMGKGFVHMDSYSATHETRGGNFIVALLSLLLAAITGGALVGVDITKPQPEVSHHIKAD